MCKVTNGIVVAEHGDPFVKTVEKAIESVDVLTKGSTLLEYFPILTRTPTWLPGTEFLRRMEEEKKAALMLKDFSWGQTKAYVVLYAHSISVNVANDYARKKARHYPVSQVT